MRYGMFMQPATRPDRLLGDIIDDNLRTIEWLEELGFDEVWHGEHHTIAEEPVPACDLVLARAMERTERIMLCTGGYVLSHYHPAALAMRIMQMDHMLKDRFICGIAAGGTPTDVPLVTGVRDIPGGMASNRRMLRESVEIMRKIWTEHIGPPWTYEGEFWTVGNPEIWGHMGPHLTPYHKPYPQMAIAGTSPRSDTLRFAGEQGMIPLSFSFGAEFIKTHWDVISEGAGSVGRTPSRAEWRIARELFVAETDAEAKKWVLDGFMGAHWSNSMLPFLKVFDWLKYLKADPTVGDEDVDVEYLIDNVWLVGSPETVVERLADLYDVTGGFGTLLVTSYDWGATPDAYRRSLALVMEEVAPRFERLRPAGGVRLE